MGVCPSYWHLLKGTTVACRKGKVFLNIIPYWCKIVGVFLHCFANYWMIDVRLDPNCTFYRLYSMVLSALSRFGHRGQQLFKSSQQCTHNAAAGHKQGLQSQNAKVFSPCISISHFPKSNLNDFQGQIQVGDGKKTKYTIVCWGLSPLLGSRPFVLHLRYFSRIVLFHKKWDCTAEQKI